MREYFAPYFCKVTDLILVSSCCEKLAFPPPPFFSLANRNSNRNSEMQRKFYDSSVWVSLGIFKGIGVIYFSPSSPSYSLLLYIFSVSRYLLEQDFPGMRIGPEPTTDSFIAVMYGESEGSVPGNALVVDPKKPFRKLSRFGNAFLNR